MAETKKITIDDLAIIVQKGFVDVEDRLSKKIDGVEKKLNANGSNIELLKEGQERIELWLMNVAYRFEVVDLQARVRILEEKMGIKPGN